jgi:hypothetical protein
MNFFEKLFHLLIRHGLVSMMCGTTEFILFFYLYSHLKFNLLPSYLISFFAASSIGFWGHSIFSFKLGKTYIKNSIFFIIQILSALSLGYLLVSLFIESGIKPAFAKAAQLIIIFSFNVIFGKMISFKKR